MPGILETIAGVLSGWTHRQPDDRELEAMQREAGLDETIAQTFPASDPPSSIPNPPAPARFTRARRLGTRPPDATG